MLRKVNPSHSYLSQSVKYRQKQHFNLYNQNSLTLQSQLTNKYQNKQNKKPQIKQIIKVRENFEKKLYTFYKSSLKSNKYRNSKYVKTIEKQVNVKKACTIWYQERLNGIQHYHSSYLSSIIQKLRQKQKHPSLKQFQQFLQNMNKVYDHQMQNYVKNCLT